MTVYNFKLRYKSYFCWLSYGEIGYGVLVKEDKLLNLRKTIFFRVNEVFNINLFWKMKSNLIACIFCVPNLLKIQNDLNIFKNLIIIVVLRCCL